MRMDAYYYGFDTTGNEKVDKLLSAVACAGKAFHQTSDWLEPCGAYEEYLQGDSPVDWIQNAANDLAKYIESAATQHEPIKTDE